MFFEQPLLRIKYEFESIKYTYITILSPDHWYINHFGSCSTNTSLKYVSFLNAFHISFMIFSCKERKISMTKITIIEEFRFVMIMGPIWETKFSN